MTLPAPVVGDAFGEGLLAYLREPDPHEATIVEREDGLVEAIPTWVFFREYDDWPPVERGIVDLARGDVLDVGCGAGPHALELAGRGHAVTVLDVSPGAVDVCRRRGLADGFVGTVEEYASATELRYRTFLMMGHNLALLESRERAPAVLGALAALAEPGAIVVGSNADPYAVDDEWHLAYHDLNRSRGRMPGQIRMRVRYRTLATDWFDYLFASPAELEALVAGSDWALDHHESMGGSYLGVLRFEG